MNLKINSLAEVRERLAASKQTTHRFHIEKFNIKNLKEIEGKKKYHVEISITFAALENLDTEADNNRASQTIRISKF
jgi:hypothetical protein